MTSIDAGDVVIRAEHLRRVFRRRGRTDVVAVDDLDLTVHRGEVLGLLGPNGAGKSTTIKMLTGILVPTSGRLEVADVDPSRHRTALARRMGVVFGQRTTLWWDLPLGDSLDLLGRVHRVPAEQLRRTRDLLLEVLDLGPLLATPVRQLSLGQRVRGDLAAALLHSPDLLYLDEPTIGLDIVSKRRLRDLLQTLVRESGVTLLLTTHDLSDVEALCRRVVVVDHGTAIFDGDLPGLHLAGGASRTLVVDLMRPVESLEVAGATSVRVEDDGRRHWLRIPQDASTAPIVAAIAATHEIADLSVREPEIEDVVERLYTGSGRPGLSD